MISEFLFKLLHGIGPIDRFGSLVVIGDELVERAFEVLRAEKVIGLQVFALKHTEPNFELIKPGRIGRQPEHLKVQAPGTSAFLLTEPAFELFRCMCGAIVQDQGHRVDLPSKGFGNDLLLHEGLEIDKAFALTAGSVDLAISNGEPGKQMPCAATMIAGFVQHRLAWARWTRRLLAFSRLNGRFLVEADQPGPFAQEASRLCIGLQHRASPF